MFIKKRKIYFPEDVLCILPVFRISVPEIKSEFYDILVNMKIFRLTHRQTKLNTIHDFTMNLKTKQMKSLVKRCTYLDLSKQYCSQHTSASLGHIPVNSVQFSLAMLFVRHLFYTTSQRSLSRECSLFAYTCELNLPFHNNKRKPRSLCLSETFHFKCLKKPVIVK